jgi:hypothetical protein
MLWAWDTPHVDANGLHTIPARSRHANGGSTSLISFSSYAAGRSSYHSSYGMLCCIQADCPASTCSVSNQLLSRNKTRRNHHMLLVFAKQPHDTPSRMQQQQQRAGRAVCQQWLRPELTLTNEASL